jgi:hypothetical protein
MSRLTEREQAVWDKRNAGLTFKQIAKELGLCVQTVSFSYRKAEIKVEYEKEKLEPTELEVYKRALGLTVNHICEVAKEDYNESHCPLRKFEKDYEDYRLECKCSGSQKLDDYYLYQARKELEDEKNKN